MKLEVIDQARALSLTHVTDNIREQPSFICNCCRCCCELMAGVQMDFHEGIAKTGFTAVIDPKRCDYCGTCFTACNVKAISCRNRVRTTGVNEHSRTLASWVKSTITFGRPGGAHRCESRVRRQKSLPGRRNSGSDRSSIPYSASPTPTLTDRPGTMYFRTAAEACSPVTARIRSRKVRYPSSPSPLSSYQTRAAAKPLLVWASSV